MAEGLQVTVLDNTHIAGVLFNIPTIKRFPVSGSWNLGVDSLGETDSGC